MARTVLRIVAAAVLAAASVATAEMPKADLTASFGAWSGSTTYEIGGTIVEPGARYEVHFPISRLEFPLDVVAVSLRGRLNLSERWQVGAEVQKNVTEDSGTLEDSDWLNDPDVLDVYSESDATLDGLVADAFLRWRFLQRQNFSLGTGLGVLWQNFDFEARNVDQWYPSAPYEPHFRSPSLGITYEVTYLIPYIEVFMDVILGEKIVLSGHLGASPLVTAEDEDHHVLRDPPITAKGDYDGTAVFLRIEGRYTFAPNWFWTFRVDGMSIAAEGEQDNTELGQFTHTTDAELSSTQASGWLAIGCQM